MQFYDGLGRLIETKTELADNVNDQGRHQVVRQVYTDRGLVARQYVPWGTPAQPSSDFLTKFEAVEQRLDQPFTSTGYDGAGRVTHVVAPDGAMTTTAYGDGWRALTDANGHRRTEYTDGYGQLAAVYEPGSESTALQFDGRDDHVIVPRMDLANRSFSIAGWVYPASNPAGDMVWLAARSSDNTRQHLHLEVERDGQVKLGFWGDDLYSPHGAVTLGAWHHVVATYDQPTDTSRLYVNGTEVASGRQGPFTGSDPTITLGGWLRDASHAWQGQLDEVRVYTTTLSADAVQAHYDGGRGQHGAPEPDLLAGWHFDEGQGSAVADYSGHGRTGTLINGPTWVPSDVARRGTHYTYDLRGNLISVTAAAGHQTTITYDGLGRKTQVQDPDTGTWTYAYDALGRLTRQTDAVGNRLTFAYDLLGRLTEQQGAPPGGPATTLAWHTYDTGGAAAHALGRRTRLTDQSGRTTWTYDQRGRVTGQTQIIIDRAYTTRWTYDPLDRPVTLTYPDSEVLTTSYGAHGLPVSAVGTQPYVTGATYSDQLQPLGWTYGNGTTAHFDYYDQPYEAAPDGKTPPPPAAAGGTALQLDGRDDYVTVPSMALERRSFSVAGWVYRDPAATGDRVWFAARENDGNRKHLRLGVRSDGAVFLDFAGEWRSTPRNAVTAGAWHHLVVTYDHPTDTSRIYVNGVQVAQGRQGPFEGVRPTILLGARGGPDRQEQHWHGQLDEVGVYRTALSPTAVQALYRGGRGLYGRPAPDLVAGWHFDEGQGTTVSDYSGHGHTGTLVHGPAWVPAAVASGAALRDYRLRQLTYRDPQQTVLQQHGYRYDRVGNITSWWQQDRQIGPWRWAATYDARDRLTNASVRTSPTGVPAAFAYTYDAIGNITRGPLGAYTYGDPAHVHAATAAGTTHTYRYDANGAVLTRTEGASTYTHGYDVQGRQTSVAVAGGATSRFIYNGDGALVARQVDGRTVAHYAAGGLYEHDRTTGVRRKYATFGGRRVAITTTGAPPGRTVQYLHQDHLGSTGLVTTATGAFASARFQAPFGAPWYTPTAASMAPALGTRFGEPWPAAGTQQPAPAATDRHYTGQRSFEASLGSLYHYGARWYSPVLGRFLSPDPIVPNPTNPQHLNRYSYVLNNPFLYTDPSGLVTVRDSAGEVWDGKWLNLPVLGRKFIGQRKLYDRGDYWEFRGGLFLACRSGRCTYYQQHYFDGYFVWQTASPTAKRPTEEDTAAPQDGHDCTDPRSTDYCLQPLPIPPFIVPLLTKIVEDIKSYKDFGKRKSGHEVHHLVEKRFWEQLGFRSKRHAEREILGVQLRTDHHGEITQRLRQKIGYGRGPGWRTKNATRQRVWEAHRDVYEEFGHKDWADRIWSEYFSDLSYY